MWPAGCKEPFRGAWRTLGIRKFAKGRERCEDSLGRGQVGSEKRPVCVEEHSVLTLPLGDLSCPPLLLPGKTAPSRKPSTPWLEEAGATGADP